MATYNELTVLYSSPLTTYTQVTVVISTTATGSGTGSSSATPLVTAIRSATGSGAGTQSVQQLVSRVRNATGSGTGTSSSITLHVVIRTSTGSGQGTSSGTAYVTFIRTATGSGTGTQTAIGARIVFGDGTSTGLGTDVFASWMKSHIFRMPSQTKVRYAQKYYDSAPDALFAHTPKGPRAKNLYRLYDGTYTTTDPRRPDWITRTYLGGHDNFLSDQEVTELTAAGYGSYIT